MYIFLTPTNEVITQIDSNSTRLPLLSDSFTQQIGENNPDNRGFSRIFNAYMSLTSLYKDELRNIERGYKILFISEENKYPKSFIIDKITTSHEADKPRITFDAIDEVIYRLNRVQVEEKTFENQPPSDIVLEYIFQSTDITLDIDDTYFPRNGSYEFKVEEKNAQANLTNFMDVYAMEMESYVELFRGKYNKLCLKISDVLEDTDNKITHRYEYGRNIKNISKVINSDFYTRFYVYGKTLEDGTIVSIDSVNNGDKFIDFDVDNDLWNQGQRHIEGVLKNEEIEEPFALMSWAIDQINSQNLSTPSFTYNVDLVLKDVPLLGETILITDKESDIVITGKVLSRVLSESNPKNNSIQIGNFKSVDLVTPSNVKKLEDEVKDLKKRLNKLGMIDVYDGYKPNIGYLEFVTGDILDYNYADEFLNFMRIHTDVNSPDCGWEEDSKNPSKQMLLSNLKYSGEIVDVNNESIQIQLPQMSHIFSISPASIIHLQDNFIYTMSFYLNFSYSDFENGLNPPISALVSCYAEDVRRGVTSIKVDGVEYFDYQEFYVNGSLPIPSIANGNDVKVEIKIDANKLNLETVYDYWGEFPPIQFGVICDKDFSNNFEVNCSISDYSILINTIKNIDMITYYNNTSGKNEKTTTKTIYTFLPLSRYGESVTYSISIFHDKDFFTNTRVLPSIKDLDRNLQPINSEISSLDDRVTALENASGLRKQSVSLMSTNLATTSIEPIEEEEQTVDEDIKQLRADIANLKEIVNNLTLTNLITELDKIYERKEE